MTPSVKSKGQNDFKEVAHADNKVLPKARLTCFVDTFVLKTNIRASYKL